LTKSFRDDPFAIPQIKEKDIKKGVMSLINRGLVPREVDLTPAFERGGPMFTLQKLKYFHIVLLF